MRNSAVRVRPAISLRNLITSVFPDRAEMPAELADTLAPRWSIMLRTATDAPVSNERPPAPRKYLWVRRTGRRAYNIHMSRMRDTIGDMNPMPAFAIFGSLVGIALLLSILIR